VDPKSAKSSKDNEEATRLTPNTESVEPSSPTLRSESVAPKLKKSNTDTQEPKRAIDRSDRALPKWKKSSRDIDDPICVKPNTDIVSPHRAAVLNRNPPSPNVQRSKTDSVEPKRVHPTMRESEDASRVMLRIDKAEPT
jgi:hypothetical protein